MPRRDVRAATVRRLPSAIRAARRARTARAAARLLLVAGRRGPRSPTSSRCRPGRAAAGLAGLGRPPSCATRSPRRGIAAPWRHQAEAADAGPRRASTSSSRTGTASGKSLAYLLPALLVRALAARPPRATVLYLAPTKALAADQLRARRRSSASTGVRAAAYDGDTAAGGARLGPRARRFVLTNPDMLHRSHAAGARAVVLVPAARCATSWSTSATSTAACSARTSPTCCAGCAGSARAYGAAARCSCSPRRRSATRRLRPPRLIGLPVAAVDRRRLAARREVTFALWEPPLHRPAAASDGAPVRRSALRGDRRPARRPGRRGRRGRWRSSGRGAAPRWSR